MESVIGMPMLPHAIVGQRCDFKLDSMNFVVVDFPLVPVIPIFLLVIPKI